MAAVDWIAEFLDDHRARVGGADWPADPAEMRAWVGAWVYALDRVEATEREAAAASLSLVLSPPNWQREHIPAVVRAIQAERSRRAEARAPTVRRGDFHAGRRAAWLALGEDERAGRLGDMAGRYPGLARWPGFLASLCMDEMAGEVLPPADEWAPPEPAPRGRAEACPVRSRPGLPHLAEPAPNVFPLADGRLMRVRPDGRAEIRTPAAPGPGPTPDPDEPRRESPRD